MKIKYLLLIFVVFIVGCRAHNNNNKQIASISNALKFKNLSAIEDYVADFLLKQGDLSKEQYDMYKKNKSTVSIYGIHNRIDADNLKDGIYSFSKPSSHSRNFFLIYHNENVKILDVSSQKGLSQSITDFLVFAEEERYCTNLINDYIIRFTNSYFEVNKKIGYKKGARCNKGLFSTDILP